jgi:hypothetical protein
MCGRSDRGLGLLDVEMLALAIEGASLVAEGELAEGMRRLDEATLVATGGEMRDIELVGQTCCVSLLDHAGYDTIPLEDFVRFVNGEHVAVPPRPLLVTFDGGRLATWRENDAILRESGLNAVVFVNVGCVQNGDPECLTWGELERMQASGGWDVQLQAVTAAVRIKYGPEPGDVGAFYAYRGTDEVLAGWRQRAFSDVTNGERRPSENVDGYRPLAFAPPFGNYGQAGTNDPRIPRELLARLEQSFAVVFTQDRSGFARPGAPNPLGRFEITRDVTDQELRALLAQAS